MRLLLGLLAPDAGDALVFSSNLGEQDLLRRNVGVLFENNGLLERFSAYDNLEYYAALYRVRDAKARIEYLLDFIGLKDRRNDLVGTFSSGMKRKLGLARAILHEPEILFLDEPSSGLDPEAQHMVRELILDLSKEESMTVFLNSHHLDEVERICSTIAILHHGEIRAHDTVERLRSGRGRTTLAILLTDSAQVTGAIRLIESQQLGIATLTGNSLAVTLNDASATPAVIEGLVRGGIRIEEVKKSARSLEEIYLEVVHQAGE